MAEKRDLTERENELLKQYREEALQVGLTIEPMDCERAARGMREIYRLCDSLEPLVYFVSSPLVMQSLGNLLLNENEVEDCVVQLLQEKIEEFLVNGERPIFDHQDVADVTESVISYFPQVANQKKQYLKNYLDGQFDASLMYYYKYLLEVLETEANETVMENYRALMDVVQSAMWVLEFDKAVIIVDRPMELYLDEEDRLHCEFAKAVEWRNGDGIYMWHGIMVPENVVIAPDTITAEQVNNESNLEVRRIMMERFGWDKWIEQVDAVLIDECDDPVVPGYKVQLYSFSDHENEIRIIKVWNGTPEIDGTHKQYGIRVRPNMSNALDALISTYPGISKDQYFNMVRS